MKLAIAMLFALLVILWLREEAWTLVYTSQGQTTVINGFDDIEKCRNAASGLLVREPLENRGQNFVCIRAEVQR